MAQLPFGRALRDLFRGVNRAGTTTGPLQAKHLPKILAPKIVKAGDWVKVSVTVGALKEHPMEPEHFIYWVGLFLNGVLVGSATLVAPFCRPAVAFEIRLERGKHTLTAKVLCNLHGLWESEAEVTAA